VGCGILLEVLDGELVGTLPCKTHPVNEGKLCIKGWYAHEAVSHKDRIKNPLVKTEGLFRQASWNEAINLVADNLNKIISTFGPDSIGVISSARCTNEENYLAQKFARAVIGTNNIDHCARTCHSPTVAGLVSAFGSGAMTNSIAEIENADCIFIIGSNTTEAHPLIGWRLWRALDKGAKLIVADPRRIQVAQLAHIHLQHLPGTDIALLNGIMNIIISNDLQDKVFVHSRTENFQALKSTVEKYPPEYVEKITGVPGDLIIRAAKSYAQAKTATILYTLGITEHTAGTKNVQSIANLAMLTGNIGKEATGVNPLRGQNNVQGACDMAALPNYYPGYQRVDIKENQQKFQAVWDKALSGKVGLTLTDMFIKAKDGELKALYIIGEDVLVSNPNVDLIRDSIKNLDFLVVQDIFMNETAKLADVVLAACSFAEKEGTFTNTERRIQRVREAIQPIGESRADWQIICQLSTKMNYTMEYSSAAEIMDEIASVVPIYAGISYKRIQKIGLQWPCVNKEDQGTMYLHKDKFKRGLGKFNSCEHLTPAEVPDEEYPLYLTTGRMIFHYNAGTMSRRTKSLNTECVRVYAELNLREAEKLGVVDGGRVRVRTRRGEVIAQVRLTENIPTGVIWMPFHFAEAPANRLTIDAFCPTARTGEYKVCAARIEPLEGKLTP
jgi:formate dehydrogenase alpha subunit